MGSKEGNQESLLSDARGCFSKGHKSDPTSVTENTGHGRKETRKAVVLSAKALAEYHEFHGLKGFGRIEATRETGGKVTSETRYFVLSWVPTPEVMLAAVRDHWAIENALHWQLDVSFREDAIARDDDRPTARKTFDAKAHADLLAEIPTLIGSLEMQRRIGATTQQLVSLSKDNVLKPRIDIPTIKSPWRVSDGLSLVAELQGMATSVDPTDNHWEGIQQAKCRSGLGVGKIIASIRARRLQIGRREDREGYAGFSVLKAEIDGLKLLKQEQSEGKMVSAAVFAHSVGMRSEGWFEKLAAAGHTPATRMPHPKWGGMRVYLSQADVAEFHKRFLTASTMEREFGLHKRTLMARLKAAKVRAFAPSCQDFGALYLGP
jgi:predicted transposase YbfD/YdcC